MHDPALHTAPLPQAVPVDLGVQSSVVASGLHIWHLLAGFSALAAKKSVPMEHPPVHVPELHTLSVPHHVPLGLVVQLVTLVSGIHIWQRLAELTTLAE